MDVTADVTAVAQAGGTGRLVELFFNFPKMVKNELGKFFQDLDFSLSKGSGQFPSGRKRTAMKTPRIVPKSQEEMPTGAPVRQTLASTCEPPAFERQIRVFPGASVRFPQKI